MVLKGLGLLFVFVGFGGLIGWWLVCGVMEGRLLVMLSFQRKSLCDWWVLGGLGWSCRPDFRVVCVLGQWVFIRVPSVCSP